MTLAKYNQMLEAGWTHLVIAQYAVNIYHAGDIVSRHKSREAAERGAKRARVHSSFLAVRPLSDYA